MAARQENGTLAGGRGGVDDVALRVGLIALAELDAETGVVMLLYLQLTWQQREEGRFSSFEDLREATSRERRSASGRG